MSKRMRQRTIQQINELRLQGKRPTEISRLLDVNVHTIRSYIKRNPVIPNTFPCRACGKEVPQNPGRKTKYYCDNKCKSRYWNSIYREGDIDEK